MAGYAATFSFFPVKITLYLSEMCPFNQFLQVLKET